MKPDIHQDVQQRSAQILTERKKKITPSQTKEIYSEEEKLLHHHEKACF